MRRGTLALLSTGCGTWLMLAMHGAAYFMGTSPPTFFQTLGLFLFGFMATFFVMGLITRGE